MADMSNYLETAISDFFFRPGAAAPTRPTSHEVSLWSVVTDAETGAGTELTSITAPGYTRMPMAFGTFVDGFGFNSARILFGVNTGGSDWPTIIAYGIHDQLGNLLQRLVPLNAPIVVPPGQRATMEIGDAAITLD